jgi:hypothetical protein
MSMSEAHHKIQPWLMKRLILFVESRILVGSKRTSRGDMKSNRGVVEGTSFAVSAYAL